MAKTKYTVTSFGHMNEVQETDWAYALRTARKLALEDKLPATIYQAGYVRAVVQPDGEFEEAR